MNPLWNLGFRPFYLLASAFAATSIALWALEVSGHLPGAYLNGSSWHAHEMLFGFTLAVITGFLFTAVRNWTGQPTPTGAVLAGYAALWLAGRILVLTPFTVTAAVVNVAFPLAVAAGIAVPLVRGGNKRNFFFIVLLSAFAAVSLAFHLFMLAVIDWPARASLQTGLDIVLFVVVVIGGRVIPMFTNNGVPGAGAERNLWVERIALASVVALLAADAVRAPDALVAIVAGIAAIAHAIRLWLWKPWRTLRAPLVWILHDSYAWIVIHLVLRVLAFAGVVPDHFAIHALTVGVIGGMTLGMMTRTARGHSGRTLEAGRAEIACYLLVMAAAVVRVFGGIFFPQLYVAMLLISAGCWSAAFATYAVAYWPVLTRPRVDGKPG